MRELFSNILQAGQKLEVVTKGTDAVSVFRGIFIASDEDSLAVKLDNGAVRIMNFELVKYVDVFDKSGSEYAAVTETEVEDDKEVTADIEGEVSESGETEEADEFSDHNDKELFNITPTLTAPKIIGKIDLDKFNLQHKSRRQASDRLENEDEEKWMPANGRIDRLGPQFGFIRPLDSEGPNIYVPRNEFISAPGILSAPEEGDFVVFSYGMNYHGPVAKCVHRQCTIATQEALIARLSNCDGRNAHELQKQLDNVYETGVPSTPPAPRSDWAPRQQQQRNNRRQIDRERIMQAVEYGDFVDGRELLQLEKELSYTATPDDYLKDADKLLRFSQTHDRPRAYQLFLRISKVARDMGRVEDALKYVREACEFYRYEPGSYNTFVDLEARITQSQNPQEETDDNEAVETESAETETEETAIVTESAPAEEKTEE